jgi:heme/copper-type cytochrome/quinol oxidase subunit 3
MGLSLDFKQKKDLYLSRNTWFFNIYDSGSLINPNEIPWLNTALLITSGITITVSHKFFKERYFYPTLLFLLITIALSFFFY